MKIPGHIQQIDEHINHLLKQVTQHTYFKQLEASWNQIGCLIQYSGIGLFLFSVDKKNTYLSQINQLTNCVRHQFFLNLSEYPLSVLICDMPTTLLDKQIQRIAEENFLPILTQNDSPLSEFIFRFKSKQLVRHPHAFESTDHPNEYLWGHTAHSLISNFLSQSTTLTDLFQSLLIANKVRHITTQEIESMHSKLLPTLIFCRIVHAILQMLRYQIGQFHTPSALLFKLRNWINQYTSQTSSEYPLKSSIIDIEYHHQEHYHCYIKLCFHQLSTSMSTTLALKK